RPQGGRALEWLTWSAVWAALVFVIDMTIRITAIMFVPPGRRPTSAMAWLLLIFFLPVPGVLLFLLIGNPRLPKKRRDVQSEVNSCLHAANDSLELGTLLPNPPAWF